jgi:hypothetical protein
MTGTEQVELLAKLFGWQLAEDARLLAELLRLPKPGPIERSGATRLFEDIAGCGLLAEVLTRILQPLRPDERRLLEITRNEISVGHRRWSLLRTETGVPVLDAEAILLPERIPDGEALKRLGMNHDGSPLDGSPPHEPLGKALRGHGVIREPLTVQLTPGRAGPAGQPQIICSRALVRGNSGPIGLVNELINKAFLDHFHDSLRSMEAHLSASPLA